MNESEQLLAAFSEDIFFKEILYTDLHYTPEGENSEVELADLIVYLGDILLAVQLKERNPGDNSGILEIEKRWLAKKGKKAKEQIKATIAQIRSGKLTELKNNRKQRILIDKDVEIVPLIVFKNDVLYEYDHILKKHNEKGMDVNCISMSDFEEICKVIVSPIEIIDYLFWRENMYLKSGKIDTFIFMDDDSFSIANMEDKETLPLSYLHQKYGLDVAQDDNGYMQIFSDYLHVLAEHVVVESERNAYYDILLFLAHLDRNEIKAFVERIQRAAECNKKGEHTICGSLRNVDQRRVMFFASSDTFVHTDYLLGLVKETGMNLEKMLQVIVYYENSGEYRIDMKLWCAGR